MTSTVAVPGASLAYFVAGDLTRCSPENPPLLIIGSPMDHHGFAPLAAHFGDRVVVTYDPRNTGESMREDRRAAVTSQQHADDLHALIEELGVGPVEIFASSGGAVNALLLAATHPGDVRTLVAHEPPLMSLLPDAHDVSEASEAIVTTYDAEGFGPAMARFIALVMHRGPVPAEMAAGPGPDPAMFGLPSEDDGSREDALMSNLRGGFAGVVLPVTELLVAPTRVVVGVGEASGGADDGEVAGRCAYAVAAALGQEAVVFPGGHAGFLDENPDHVSGFAARLREVLTAI